MIDMKGMCGERREGVMIGEQLTSWRPPLMLGLVWRIRSNCLLNHTSSKLLSSDSMAMSLLALSTI